MQVGKYYLTNTEGTDKEDVFKKVLLYLKDNTIKFTEARPFNAVVRCMLKIPKVKIIGPFTDRDLEFNEKINVKIDTKYLNGFLWKIDETILESLNDSDFHDVIYLNIWNKNLFVI